MSMSVNNKFEYKRLLKHQYQPLHKIRAVISGFWFIIKYDFSVTYKLIISIFVLGLTLYFNEYINGIIVLLATGYMLSMEIINTCVELLCDFQIKKFDPKIKIIKDVAAVSAGISIIIWLVVIIYDLIDVVEIVFNNELFSIKSFKLAHLNSNLFK